MTNGNYQIKSIISQSVENTITNEGITELTPGKSVEGWLTRKLAVEDAAI